MQPNRGGYGRGRGMWSSEPQRYQQKSTYNRSRSVPGSSLSPQQEASNVITIDLELDEESAAFMSKLKSNWTYLKKSPSVVALIRHRFETSLNPYEELLRLMFNSSDFKYAKPKSLTMLLIEEFEDWSKQFQPHLQPLLRPLVKISAFNIVRQQTSFALMKLVALVFKMAADCDIFLEIIRNMIQNKQYKEACQSAALLGLHNKFGIDDFLVPLILQDKIIIVDEFLAESPRHQMEVTSFLDEQLGKSISVRLSLDTFIFENQIPEIKWDKLHYKPFRKLVTRFKKMYNLPDVVTPSLIKKQNEGALQFLVNRRYCQNAIGAESFKEMVHEAVQHDKNLQVELMFLISYHGDLETALHFAHVYNIAKDDWPMNVSEMYDNPVRAASEPEQEEEDGWNDPKEEFYKLKLPSEFIVLIENDEDFENFLENHLKKVKIVGIDCEWKPSFGSQINELALMQIATRTQVFILDVVQMGNNCDVSLWQKLSQYCFNNCDILKLGFGLTSDMSMIRQSLPHMSMNQKNGFLDLLGVWKQMDKHAVKLPHEVKSGGASLSTLVQMCFGMPLNKADQFSNWEKRPLRASQLEYAALDAFCLIEIYDVFKSCAEEVKSPKFSFHDLCYSLMTNSGTGLNKKVKKPLNKKKPTEIIPQPGNEDFHEVDASEIRMVCDNMLQGLGKLLRKCGIDTKILDNSDEHSLCLQIYQNEKRYILTRGQTFNMFFGSTPKGHCFNVPYDDINQQLESVLEYYKIRVRKEHVFSICQACNGNKFIKVPQSTMQTLVQNAAKLEKMAAYPGGYYDDDGADEATGFTSEEDYDYDPAEISHSTRPRKWKLHSHDQIDIQLVKTSTGTKIQVWGIPEGILNTQDFYYVCESCGKVYWDGSHFEKILSCKLQNVVI